MAFIEIKNLSFSYPNTSKNAIENISLDVEEGDFVVICGSSGCGKSTLIRQLKTEIAPHGNKTGEIKYDGILINDLNLRRGASEIGFVMQNPQNQIVTDKVWHELAFGLENLGCDTKTIRVRVCEMASFFGISGWFDKKTSELSGGQMQLLNLASVMAMQPKVLLLDEPTSQLDPIAATEFIETLKKVNRDTGLTIIIVEHRLEEVFSIADKIVIMDKGKILLTDEPKNIGEKLKRYNRDEIMLSLPTALRVYESLDIKDDCPLTARDGRRFLSKNFINEIKSVKPEPEKNVKKTPVLELNNIWFRYSKESDDVLKGINFKAYECEIVSIVGSNGAGKTTMLSVMSRLLKPYRGKISLNGENIRSYSASELYHNNLTVLPQNPQSIFVMDTVLADLNEVCNVMKYDKQTAKEKINKVTNMLNISELLQSHPYDLSGGEQQKAALAKVLLLNPKVILLDEPTKGIDAYSKKMLANILNQLKNQGATIIIVTHDIEFSASYSDRCAMFFNGEIISEDETVSFYSGNSFYTTVANKMSRHMYNYAITCEDVIELCKKNPKRKD